MKKSTFKNLSLNKKSISNLHSVSITGGTLNTRYGCSDTAQSFCLKKGGSCNTCPVGTASEQSVCCE
ncbi:MAG: hypothetical protein AAF611_22120 [Bacteroidota bacterium]